MPLNALMLTITLVAAPAADAGPVAWREALAADLTAADAAMRDSHPAMYDARNPGFSRQLDAALAQARLRTAAVEGHAGYWWVLKGYSAAFDDGHVSVNPLPGAPTLPARWPGFLTGFDGAQQIVMTREAGAGLPPLGATLASCDGTTAAALAQQRVGDFNGRWNLQSTRSHAGGEVLLDQGNPFIPVLRSCTFIVQGRATVFDLSWRPIEAPDLAARLSDTRRSFRPPNREHSMPGGGRWITTSSFNADPSGSNFKALTQLLQTLTPDAAQLQSAPVVVLDVRGNSGGASQWSIALARLIWGEDRVDAVHDPSWVEWRASTANLARLVEFEDKMKPEPQASPEVLRMLASVTAGMRQAIARGEPLWRAPPDSDAGGGSPAVEAPDREGSVFVVADAACGSACLDALDLWKQLGAIQVGVETSADTVYMDVRPEMLPSGLARISVPMKVFRGRVRGFNETHVPSCRYDGDMRDDRALEAWVLRLDAAQRASGSPC